MSKVFGRIVKVMAGPRGRGVPAGGTTGQVLAKASDSDDDTEWQTSASTWTKVAVPANSDAAGADGQYSEDGSYFYFYSATASKWRRVPMMSF